MFVKKLFFCSLLCLGLQSFASQDLDILFDELRDAQADREAALSILYQANGEARQICGERSETNGDCYMAERNSLLPSGFFSSGNDPRRSIVSANDNEIRKTNEICELLNSAQYIEKKYKQFQNRNCR